MNITSPFDGARSRFLSILGPIAPSLIRDRDRRVLVYGLVSITTALALTFLAPMVLLAIGPLVLGVPHLVADIRYLVVRPKLHRQLGVWLFVFLPALASFIHPHAWVSMIACVGAACLARRPVIAFAMLALVVGARELGYVADLIFAHAHNAIAVAIFILWARRESNGNGNGSKPSYRFVIPIAFAIGLAAIAFGVFDSFPAVRLTTSKLLDAEDLFATLAPPLDNPIFATRMVLAFAFAQSVHYAVWVRLIPERDRPRPGMRSFASSLRALRGDFGLPLVFLFAVAAIAIAVWGLISIADARDGYLRLAVFHGPLELGVMTLLLFDRRRESRSLIAEENIRRQ